MTDTRIKGTGNSRTLGSVPNFKTLYPDYDAFAAAVAAKTLPIDIGPLNPAGIDVHGTDLNKAALLTDATAALFGKTETATPNEVFAAIKSRFDSVNSSINSVSSTASSKANSVRGSYSGNGAESKTLSFSFSPKLVVITGTWGGSNPVSISFVYGITRGVGSGMTSHVIVSWGGNSVTINTSNNYLNTSGGTYYYAAIG